MSSPQPELRPGDLVTVLDRDGKILSRAIVTETPEPGKANLIADPFLGDGDD